MKTLHTVLLLASLAGGLAFAAERPNVIVILTDDQGYGDLSLTGNAVLKTPHIDSLARDGAWLKNFYVSPVCSPTRASFLTGRYHQRTGVVDTYQGRSLMHADEVTLAEMLKGAGYRTGIFGKWHLGDNYPLRAIDQGFDEALVLRGGGIGQWSDPPGGERYHDPILSHNGVLKKTPGYCSDVYTDYALEFIEKNREQPFFVYMPFNAPHGPLETPAKEWETYKDADVLTGQPNQGAPMKKPDVDAARKVYAMVANIDANVGRLLKKLDDLKLAENTIIVFFTDNGAQQQRYNYGLRGLKASVYEGGIRVPCFVRWKGRVKPGTTVDAANANIDLAPSLLDACGVAWPAAVKKDGRSFWPALSGQAQPDRSLFFQWHRGDVPQAQRAFAVRAGNWKLVQAAGAGEKQPLEPKYELFDLAADPYEQNDLAAQKPELVEKLKAEHDAWHQSMKSERQFVMPSIILNSARENPVVLTRQDWRNAMTAGFGCWDVVVEKPGTYTVTLSFKEAASKATVSLGGVRAETALASDARQAKVVLKDVPAGATRVEAVLESGDKPRGPMFVQLDRND